MKIIRSPHLITYATGMCGGLILRGSKELTSAAQSKGTGRRIPKTIIEPPRPGEQFPPPAAKHSCACFKAADLCFQHLTLEQRALIRRTMPRRVQSLRHPGEYRRVSTYDCALWYMLPRMNWGAPAAAYPPQNPGVAWTNKKRPLPGDLPGYPPNALPDVPYSVTNRGLRMVYFEVTHRKQGTPEAHWLGTGHACLVYHVRNRHWHQAGIEQEWPPADYTNTWWTRFPLVLEGQNPPDPREGWWDEHDYGTHYYQYAGVFRPWNTWPCLQWMPQKYTGIPFQPPVMDYDACETIQLTRSGVAFAGVGCNYNNPGFWIVQNGFPWFKIDWDWQWGQTDWWKLDAQGPDWDWFATDYHSTHGMTWYPTVDPP